MLSPYLDMARRDSDNEYGIKLKTHEASISVLTYNLN